MMIWYSGCAPLSIICVSSILFIFLFHQVMIIIQVEKALYWLIYICFSVVSKAVFGGALDFYNA